MSNIYLFIPKLREKKEKEGFFANFILTCDIYPSHNALIF